MVEECKEALINFEQYRGEGQEVRLRAKWREGGDTTSKELFKAIKER